MKVRIQGKVHGHHDWTGREYSRKVSFVADSKDAWCDIVDRAFEIADRKVNNPRVFWDQEDLDEVEA